MSKYDAPTPRKFSAKQEAEHRKWEASVEYVAEHREQFLEMLAAIEWSVEGVATHAHAYGKTFDESLFVIWLSNYHPNAASWDFKVKSVDFSLYLKFMPLTSPSTMKGVSTGQ
jgi:hypothetical protein